MRRSRSYILNALSGERSTACKTQVPRVTFTLKAHRKLTLEKTLG